MEATYDRIILHRIVNLINTENWGAINSLKDTISDRVWMAILLYKELSITATFYLYPFLSVALRSGYGLSVTQYISHTDHNQYKPIFEKNRKLLIEEKQNRQFGL